MNEQMKNLSREMETIKKNLIQILSVDLDGLNIRLEMGQEKIN